jgi:hypothetical protein
MAITRLTGGLTPADGSDPRTFPAIWNSAADEIESIVLQVYPVGSIYMSVVNTNPGTLFGGTWVEFGSGRVVVGVNTSDADFDAAEKTGGAKTHSHTTPSHTHSSAAHSHLTAFGWDETNFYYALNSTTSLLPRFTSNVISIPRREEGIPGGTNVSENPARIARTDSETPGVTGGASPTTNTSSSLQPFITAYMFKRTA